MGRSWCLLSITGFSATTPGVLQPASSQARLVMPRKIKMQRQSFVGYVGVTYLCVSSVIIKRLPDPAVNL
jgi:hypothetical protein